MIGSVSTKGNPDPTRTRFAPRITLTVLAGFAVFFLSAGLYALPALLEEPPPGAIPDYQRERVSARLEGKVLYFLIGAFAGVTIVSLRRSMRGARRS